MTLGLFSSAFPPLDWETVANELRDAVLGSPFYADARCLLQASGGAYKLIFGQMGLSIERFKSN